MPFFTPFQYLHFVCWFFFICQKISFSTNLFLVSPFDVAFLCVSLSTLRAYFSLFTVFATWRRAIEKLEVDCMGISYFSFPLEACFSSLLFLWSLPSLNASFLYFQIILLIFPSLALSFHFVFPFTYCCLIFNFSGRVKIRGSIQITMLWINTLICISALLTNTNFLTASVLALCSLFFYYTLSNSSYVGSIKCYSYIITTVLYNPLQIRSVWHCNLNSGCWQPISACPPIITTTSRAVLLGNLKCRQSFNQQ